MSIHRMNWCRLCGICLTCPRTQKSQFQQGTCHCVERQANHVPPKRVKGEQLFSFRYRHLNLEDIEILIGIQQRFNLPTPPIERNLARANICSTCQQRLRRARMALCSSSSMPHSSQPVPIRFPQISSAPILPPVSSLPCFPKSNISTLRSTFTPSFDTSQQLQNKLPPLAVLANYADQLNTNNNRPTAGPNPDSKINTFSTLSAEHVSDDPDKTLVDPSFSNNKLAPALKKSADGGATKEGLRLLLHGMSTSVEFRDASGATLFSESLSHDYPLEDVFYKYCPQAPGSLLFYLQGDVALPKQSTLDDISSYYDISCCPVVIWAKSPVSANPDHIPQW